MVLKEAKCNRDRQTTHKVASFDDNEPPLSTVQALLAARYTIGIGFIRSVFEFTMFSNPLKLSGSKRGRLAYLIVWVRILRRSQIENCKQKARFLKNLSSNFPNFKFFFTKKSWANNFAVCLCKVGVSSKLKCFYSRRSSCPPNSKHPPLKKVCGCRESVNNGADSSRTRATSQMILLFNTSRSNCKSRIRVFLIRWTEHIQMSLMKRIPSFTFAEHVYRGSRREAPLRNKKNQLISLRQRRNRRVGLTI